MVPRLALAAAFVLARLASAPAATAFEPRVGQKASFTCIGNQHEIEYTVSSVDNGIVRYQITLDGIHRNLKMPAWFLGTSLYLDHSGEKWPSGQMTAGLEAFDGLKTPKAGLVLHGMVTETVTGHGPASWNFDIKIVDERQIDDKVLGKVEVYVIEETRTGSGASSQRTSFISPAHAEVVYWKYSDSAGRFRECHITSLTGAS